MSNVLYVHKRNVKAGVVEARGGITVAMDELQSWFVEGLKEGDFFEKKVGQARCSDEDNYSKAAGRELSKGRMKAKRFTVTVVSKEGDALFVVLTDSDGFRYTLAKYKNANSVFFEEFGAQ